MASNTKHRKNHKQKLAARKNRLANEKVRAQKAQRDFIMNLIKQEQERGAFDNTANIDGPVVDAAAVDAPFTDARTIEGPSL